MNNLGKGITLDQIYNLSNHLTFNQLENETEYAFTTDKMIHFG